MPKRPQQGMISLPIKTLPSFNDLSLVISIFLMFIMFAHPTNALILASLCMHV